MTLAKDRVDALIAEFEIAPNTASMINALLQNSPLSWPKRYGCRYIEPGLVAYAEFGTVLVGKDVLDLMAQSFVGKPVINEIHKSVSPAVYQSGEADGIVTRVWYNAADGWYWCEFLVWDEATQRNCASDAYSVSCAYTVSEADPSGGTHNNVPFEQEITGGEYTHLAIVPNPRYEGARIVVYNSKDSKGASAMFKFFKKKDKEKVELANAEAGTTLVDGKAVLVKDLIEAHNALRARTQKTTVANAEPLAEDTMVEIDGEETSLKNLADSYRTMKNAEEEEKKKKEDEERKNAEEKAEKDKKDKEDEERKNAEEKEKADKEKKDKEMENARSKEHFNRLDAAASLRGSPQTPQVMTRREMAQLGSKRYGSEKAA